jgi:hypothetical protein
MSNWSLRGINWANYVHPKSRDTHVRQETGYINRNSPPSAAPEGEAAWGEAARAQQGFIFPDLFRGARLRAALCPRMHSGEGCRSVETPAWVAPGFSQEACCGMPLGSFRYRFLQEVKVRKGRRKKTQICAMIRLWRGRALREPSSSPCRKH